MIPTVKIQLESEIEAEDEDKDIEEQEGNDVYINIFLPNLS